MKALASHSSRHFSLAKLLRIESNLRNITKGVASFVRSKLLRVQSPPPVASAKRLQMVLELL